jgi:hypothetical protein
MTNKKNTPMKTDKILIYILLLSLISSCVFIRNDCGMRSPKTYFFKILKKNEFKLDTIILNTNGVYYSMRTINSSDTIYSFKRFFKNGRYFGGGSRNGLSDNKVLNSTCNGNYGHYILKNDTIIVENHNASAGYVYHYYKASGNEIELIGSKKRKLGKAKFTPHTGGIKYKFHKANMYSKSNW